MVLLWVRLLLFLPWMGDAVLEYSESYGWHYAAGNNRDVDDPRIRPIPALTPAQGCDKLFPSWINEKVMELHKHRFFMPHFIQYGLRTWKYPIMGVCYGPLDDPFRPGRPGPSFHLRCADKFWYQINEPIPWYEDAISAMYKITCDLSVTETNFTFHVVPNLRRGGWWECFCKPLIAFEQSIRPLQKDCLTVTVGGFGTILGWLSSAFETILSTLTITEIERDPNSDSEGEREVSQVSTAGTTLARDVTPGQYQTCLENHGRATELSLHAGYVPKKD